MTRLIAITAEIEDQAAHGIRGIHAVTEDRVPVGVTLDGLILAKGLEEIGEGLARQVFSNNGFAQSDEDGMSGLAFVAGVEFAFPPMEELESASGIFYFIAEVVRPSAISVDIIKMLVKAFWQEPGDDVEILVVMRGEPARISLRHRR